MIYVIECADVTCNWEPADCPDNILLASRDRGTAWRAMSEYQADADHEGEGYRYRLISMTDAEAEAYCARWDLDGPAFT